MNEMHKCEDTSSENIQSSSHLNETSQPKSVDPLSTRKQQGLTGNDMQPGNFQLYDLKRLTFKPIGSETIVDVWHAEAQMFQTYVQQFANIKEKEKVWGLMERVFFLNQLWEFCQKHGYQFPFTIGENINAQ